MSETTAGRAQIKANNEMDAIYVDDNNSAIYLPDMIARMDAAEADFDPTPVIVEAEGKGKLVLTIMEDGYRTGHYGTILDTDHPEAAQYE